MKTISHSQSNEPQGVYKVVERFRRWLHVPDPNALIAMLGAYIANQMSGDPVWLLLIGPSSAGKTQMLMSLAARRDARVASTLTEASLLSGTPKKENAKHAKGGLLQEIGSSGVILLKDFTSTLSMPHESRTSTLAALREIYDGQWVRHVGVDGGLTLEWKGKIGIVAGCTEAIDKHHGVISSMGQRFLLYRLPRVDEDKVAVAALEQSGSEGEMRRDLEGAVEALFTCGIPDEIQLPDEETQRIKALAVFTARSRSSVERDSRSREIELIPQPESPSRLAKQLSMLYRGLRGIGAVDTDIRKILAKSAFDCIPPVRYKVLGILDKATEEMETAEIAGKILYPLTTTRRSLEDLAAHKVIARSSDGVGSSHYWALSPWAKLQLRTLRGSVPEKSGSER